MNKKQKTKKIKTNKLKWSSFQETFSKASKTGKFKKAYKEELFRLALAKQIREIRIASNLTQKAVAQKAKMTQSVIARIESGENGLSLDTLQRIATVFGKEVQLV